ncbi:hypothetical protein ACFLZM_00620 [Thermodesulfobacteriota bacterium]
MGGLAHFFEKEGVPTTQISLIRLHTEKIKPPRALWTPFELGRPFGVPNNPAFQRRVLLAALKLFEAPDGPVLADFPDEAPASPDPVAVLSCPVSFPEQDADLSETGKLCDALKREMISMQPWYDLAVKKRGRTTVGVSGLDLNNLGDFICAFLDECTPENPRNDVTLAYSLKLATDDIKAFYFEGIIAQPGQESPSVRTITQWFWQHTVAAKVLHAVKKVCLKNENPEMRRVGASFIVPLL